MLTIEAYWCEATPTLEDIKTAYDIVKSSGVAVKIEWSVKYNGAYSRIITKEIIENVPSYEDYFKKYIPHCYGL